jgi:hypothetical protein
MEFGDTLLNRMRFATTQAFFRATACATFRVFRARISRSDEALDGAHGAAVALDERVEAGRCRVILILLVFRVWSRWSRWIRVCIIRTWLPPGHDDRASAAPALPAAHLGTREPRTLAQVPRERPRPRLGQRHGVALAVDRELDYGGSGGHLY